jgi:hypothetical protein
MSLLAGTLGFARSMAEMTMTETIQSGTEKEGINPSTRKTELVFTVEYDGPAQVKYPALNSSTREAGGQQYELTSVVVKVPASAAIIPPNRIIRVTASTVDPSLIGRRYRVKDDPQSGAVSSHRYPVEGL